MSFLGLSSPQIGVITLSAIFLQMTLIMILSCLWEPSNDSNNNTLYFTVIKIIVIFVIACTWIFAYLGGYNRSPNLIIIAYSIWMVFYVAWIILALWSLFFQNISAINDGVICSNDRCITTMLLMNHKYKSPDKTEDPEDPKITTDDESPPKNPENTPDVEETDITPSDPSEDTKDPAYLCACKATPNKCIDKTSKGFRGRHSLKTKNQRNPKAKKNLKVSKNTDLLRNKNTKLSAVVFNGLPWTMIIAPLVLFALFRLGLLTLKDYKNELKNTSKSCCHR